MAFRSLGFPSMKTSTIAALALAALSLAACKTKPVQPTYSLQTFPEIDAISTAEIGEEMVEQGDAAHPEILVGQGVVHAVMLAAQHVADDGGQAVDRVPPRFALGEGQQRGQVRVVERFPMHGEQVQRGVLVLAFRMFPEFARKGEQLPGAGAA